MGVVALLAGCVKSQPITTVDPGSTSSTTATATATAPAATVPATAPPATDRPTTGKTSTDDQPEIDTWTGTNQDDDEFAGDVRCSEAGLSFVMTFAMDDADATFEAAFSEVGDEEGEFEGLDGDGKLSANGPVSMSSTEFETDVDGEPGSGISFSMRIDAVDLRTDETNELEIEGACAIRMADFGLDPGGAPAGSAALALPVSDADAFMEALVDVAFPAIDADEPAFGAPAAWIDAGLPASAIEDFDVPATPETISGSKTSVDALGAYEVYAFAVEDTAGECAFGFVYFTEDQPEPTTRRISTGIVSKYGANQCSGAAALEYFGTDVLD